jgi:hypothetical protein
MNPSKGAAVLMLVGAFAAGVGTPIVYKAIADSRPQVPACPQPRTPASFIDRFSQLMERLGEPLDSTQRQTIESLINERNRLVGDIYAVPRARAESAIASARAFADSILNPAHARATAVRDSIKVIQDSVFTPTQRAKLDERNAAARVRNQERQAQRQAQQARCEGTQPKQTDAAGSKQQPTKTKSNH